MKYIGRRYKSILRAVIAAAAMCFLSCMTVYAAGSSVMFKTGDKPLIDLGEFVKDSDPGKMGNPETGHEGDAAGESSPDDSQSPTSESEAETAAAKAPVISITHTYISLDGAVCQDTDDLKKRLGTDLQPGTTVHLVDNYAESHTYKSVYKLIAEMAGVIIEEEVAE